MSETLKAWCHWKRKDQTTSEDDLAMVKDIEDLVSQVGTWKSKYERLEAKYKGIERALVMVLGSSLMEADGHDWTTCQEPSCFTARQYLPNASVKEPTDV